MSLEQRTAVYSTLHPGMMAYVGVWAASVAAQTDLDFDLWLAVDGVTEEDVEEAVPAELNARLHWAPEGSTPAAIRADVFAILVDEYDFVVMVDADDVLHRTRVAAAKRTLVTYDVAACALQLIDASGRDLGADFGIVDTRSPNAFDDLLPRWNVFGGSNSAYRASSLRSCLPIPSECLLVDWFLATSAWAHGARFYLDETPRMAYRQYPDNTAKVHPPFSADAVRAATRLVRSHYDLVLGQPMLLEGARRAAVDAARNSTIRFSDVVLSEKHVLDRYVAALNELPPPQVWWTVVAHPDLEALWTE